MNYSLIGKARKSAKATMKTNAKYAANVANYANRDATKMQGLSCYTFGAKGGLGGGYYVEQISGTVDRSKKLNVK